MSATAPEMVLWSCTQIGERTFSMMVIERWLERGWLRVTAREETRNYVLNIRVGRWMDGDRYVLRQDPRHFRLWELFGAWCIDQKFSANVGIPTLTLSDS